MTMIEDICKLPTKAPYIFQNYPVYLIVGIQVGEMQLARLHETPTNDERRS